MAMIRPKTEMKDSGIEWVGNIPNDWNTKPLYACLDEINQKNNPVVTTNILSLTNTDGVIPYSERGNQGNKSKENFEEYKVVYPNTIVANSMNILIGSVGLSKYEGCVSPVYYVYMAKPQVDIRYMNYLFQMEPFQKRLRQFANGILEIRLRASSHDILHQKVAVPDYDEQQAIADCLDETCSQIDEIIAEAKASIDEYKELKQSVIFEAVTKGLDKNVEVKAVNLEYLDSCPMDWNILPVSILFDFFGGFAYKSDRFCEETNNQVVRLGNVKDDELRLNSNPVYVSDEYADDSSKAAIKVDDILFTMTGTRGKGDYFYTLIITEDDLKEKNLFLNQRVGCFRKAYHTVYMPYYNYLLKSPKIRERVFLYETGTANQGNIGIENINRIRLYNPPMEVQKNIVRMLNQKCNTIDSLITEKESLINDLEAYKKSLIYEVVTGKRRVV